MFEPLLIPAFFSRSSIRCSILYNFVSKSEICEEIFLIKLSVSEFKLLDEDAIVGVSKKPKEGVDSVDLGWCVDFKSAFSLPSRKEVFFFVIGL